MKIDNKLLEKYNVAVPRYTSYPPANHFSDGFTSADQETLLVQSNSWQPQHIALYVHIPFCKKICFYCGCNACRLNSSSEVRKLHRCAEKGDHHGGTTHRQGAAG